MGKEQPAAANDGVSNAPLKGQKESIDQGNTPAGMGNLKGMRNTGEIKQGTSYLRGQKAGENSDRNPV